MNFRQFNDDELGGLPDEELIAYVTRARKAGQLDAAVTAVQVLAYSYEDRVRGFIYNQLGSKGARVVDEVAERTIADAIASAASFQGDDIKQFRAWVFQIARRRRVDYLRKRRVDEVPMAFERGEDSDEREFGEGDPIDAIDRGSIFNQALSELNKDEHKFIVLLDAFRDLPHKQIAEHVNRHFGDRLDDPMSEQNVNKILSRFHKRLDKLLDEADDPAPPTDDDD